MNYCVKLKRDRDGVCPEISKFDMSSSASNNFSWAVARTKARAEKALAEYLTARSVPTFVPLLVSRRVYGRSVRHSQLPLFPGYVFFDDFAISRSSLFESRKVADVLRPPDPNELRRELANLALALQADSGMRATIFGMAGAAVQVVRGPLKGVVGELVRLQNENRLVVRVSFLGKAAELEIDEAFVERVL